ncbi:MAG: hypothetical protein QG670_645 [Thermoproteota archaeon]|nr:hypothetical protein [Thermoproteota archaeon]
MVRLLNPEHLKIVKKGASEIEKWWHNNHGRRLDLSEANLIEADLSGANLAEANLIDANLSRANLRNANLPGAKLTNSRLFEANLFNANLIEADLSGANLTYANLYLTDLSEANLSNNFMLKTHFREIKAANTKFHKGILGGVDFVDCDLSQIEGLDTVKHLMPSSIGMDTLVETFKGVRKGSQPELEKTLKTFFMKAGVLKELLEAFPKILAEVKYMTAFIVYDELDASFAERLHDDLIMNGVSCWLYKTDYTMGENTWREISNKRREAEKFIVLCSSNSLVKDGLLKELEEQVDEYVEKIVPISLDEQWKQNGFFVMRADLNLKQYILDRNYADFGSNFNYKDNLEKLLKALEKKT